MTTNTTAQTEQTTEQERIQLGAFSTSKALMKLYEYAAPHLSDAELEFISGAISHASMEADHMAKITEDLGCLIANDNGSGAFDESLPTLLFQVSNHMDLVSGLTWIGNEAEYRLNNPDKAFPLRMAG
jgi:hypothetical protein